MITLYPPNNAAVAAITSGAIDGTTIGATTPSTGAFTTLSATGAATVTATAGNALTITNTGTGNCLVVEDSASPDATPTVIDAAGRIITGHTAALTLAGYNPRIQNHDANGVMYARWSNDTGAETALHVKSRSATVGAFSIVTTGDVVADNLFAGDDGTAMVLAGYHRFQITGTPAVGNIQGKHIWATRNTAGVLASRMELSSEGDLSVVASIKSANPTAGIGYAIGAGSVVTQLTSKATGVTLNTVCGDITLNSASLAADTTVSFIFTNSALAAGDTLNIYHNAVGAGGSYNVTPFVSAGSAVVYVRNVTAGALAEAIVLRFSIIKGVLA